VVVPWLLAGTDAVAFVDVDTIRQVHGYKQHGPGSEVDELG